MKIWDLVIIGGGPAGLSAAIYTSRDQIETLILESNIAGGMMALTAKVDNYPGFMPGTTGFEIGQKMSKQAEQLGAKIKHQKVVGVSKIDENLCLELDSGERILTKTALIATGTKYRKLNIPGERELIGKGVHFCATCDGAFYTGKEIAVIGGGNSAVEEAIFLTKYASKIYLIVRGELTANYSYQNDLEPFIKKGQIEVITNAETTEIIDQGDQNRIVKYNKNNSNFELEVAGIFVFIGMIPNLDFALEIEVDQYDFIKIDQNNMTNLDGVFACGDITASAIRQIATASADGIKAALKISNYLRKK